MPGTPRAGLSRAPHQPLKFSQLDKQGNRGCGLACLAIVASALHMAWALAEPLLWGLPIHAYAQHPPAVWLLSGSVWGPRGSVTVQQASLWPPALLSHTCIVGRASQCPAPGCRQPCHLPDAQGWQPLLLVLLTPAPAVLVPGNLARPARSPLWSPICSGQEDKARAPVLGAWCQGSGQLALDGRVAPCLWGAGPGLYTLHCILSPLS